jgi:hypothetical protein
MTVVQAKSWWGADLSDTPRPARPKNRLPQWLERRWLNRKVNFVQLVIQVRRHQSSVMGAEEPVDTRQELEASS